MLKTLKKYIGEYKNIAISAPVFIIVEVILEMFIPRLMASIIDDGLGTGNMSYVVKVGLVMLVVSFAAVRFFQVNIILIILTCGVIGAVDTCWRGRAGEERK